MPEAPAPAPRPPDFPAVETGEDELQRARALLAEDLDRFQLVLDEALAPQAPYLTQTERELYRRGKRLRPMMMLLSARMAGACGPGTPLPSKVIKGSVALEMLHVATLIHDDIVDVAPTRRGLPSVPAARGNHVAVLVGDLQFIQAIRCFAADVDTQSDMDLVRLVLDVAFKICCGELDELQTDPNWTTDVLVSRYYNTVDRKTAVLFGLACESGATLMGVGSRATYCVSRFGRLFGRAFQIMDDLLDVVVPQESSGKRQGIDLIERRLSLPIIYALAEHPEAHPLHRIMRGEPYSEQELQRAIDAVARSEGFLRAYREARALIVEATSMLEAFEPSPYRDALVAQAESLINRRFA